MSPECLVKVCEHSIIISLNFVHPFLDRCGKSGTTLAIANADDLSSINDCPVISGSLYINAQGDIDTLTLPPNLHTVTGGLFCSGASLTYLTDTIIALGLGTIGSDHSDNSINGIGLVISDYSNLATLKFPNLTTIGSNFVVARNSLLNNIDGFQAVQTVSGNLDITGNFDTFTLPSVRATNATDVRWRF